MGLALKNRLTEPAAEPRRPAAGNSSVLLDATLIANHHAALAVMWAAILLGRNSRSSLYVGLEHRGTIPFDFARESQAAQIAAAIYEHVLLRVGAGLQEMTASPAGAVVLQFDFTAASLRRKYFARVRSAGANPMIGRPLKPICDEVNACWTYFISPW